MKSLLDSSAQHSVPLTSSKRETFIVNQTTKHYPLITVIFIALALSFALVMALTDLQSLFTFDSQGFGGLALLSTPILFGIIGAIFVFHYRHLSDVSKVLWALGAIFSGPVAIYFYYVLATIVHGP